MMHYIYLRSSRFHYIFSIMLVPNYHTHTRLLHFRFLITFPEELFQDWLSIPARTFIKNHRQQY
jgi:hypothetical protein